MDMLTRFTILAALVFSMSQAFAADTLIVEGMVSPAWVEHGGRAREPLTLGMSLGDKDKVRTGSGARVLLRMSEGSAVKLGENAVLAVDDLQEKPGANAGRLVAASLDVVRGALRFTTEVFARQQADRDIKIRIRTVMAGIRGTDVWGKSTSEQDVVCLVEGKIDVRHGGRQFTMQDPLSFFIAPRTGEPKPVAPVPKKQIEDWIKETEIHSGGGAIRKGGSHEVLVATSEDQNTARQVYEKVREAGFPAEMETVSGSYGAGEYRVRVLNLAAPQDSQAVARKLQSMGFATAEAVR